VLNSYLWRVGRQQTLRRRRLALATRWAARCAKAVVLMTGEQSRQARRELAGSVPVIRFRCGIDTAFYGVPSRIEDVPDEFRARVDDVLSGPYVVMPGDELRCDADALEIVSSSKLRLVRIFQYYDVTRREALEQEIVRRGLRDRFFVFERISYPFMRFLLQHASAYAGLVDSDWQPAGWTVACEALASGLPAVLYEGLVSRELADLGAPPEVVRSVRMGRTDQFRFELQRFVDDGARNAAGASAREFAATKLDLEQSSAEFVAALEGAFTQEPRRHSPAGT